MIAYIFVHKESIEIKQINAENELRAWAILLEDVGNLTGWSLEVTLLEDD